MKNPYLLLTPGPLSTSESVREAMRKDWCTWDHEYMLLVQKIRQHLVNLATHQRSEYTSVLMQGSGTFTVESVIGSVIPREYSKLLIATNGAYGNRIIQMAEILGIQTVISRTKENEPTNLYEIEKFLQADPAITHVAVVHCETTTGILNPVEDVCKLAKAYNKNTIVDAMSSFGGIELDVHEWKIDFLISSANKCIQGVPGFGFVIAKTEELEKCEGISHSLSLDLYDQWKTMEDSNGKWRFTSPTHVVRAFYQALIELEEEGGVTARNKRYRENQTILVEGMRECGFMPFVLQEYQSPIITSFLHPNDDFEFNAFYQHLKEEGFVIYPGKVSEVLTFRIGTIGEVDKYDISRLIQSIKKIKDKQGETEK
ncbi:2-aminoethylphosphonate--pyruvate transaminase [uncultured Metabacillus sp.]|uniref:2-aminoethylphosphonate--pyruvate transaminase n=1 Tax=uncultured Metabacillus sp. TaxID=2860135 RepID=UPI0026061A8B|nr:2-aminoethylphosphonate--pyruvate transaminase [uncultured Metabacillus sp.]